MKKPLTRLILSFVFLAIFHSPGFAQFTKLIDFAGATNGRNPYGSLISDGIFLYGMTTFGGTNDSGTIFKIKPDGTGYVKLFDFDYTTTGAGGYGSLISDGAFIYGMTDGGGANYRGTIFKYCLRPTKSTDTVSACGSYTWNGNTYTFSGTYTDTIPNAEGCDSIMTLHLTIKTPTSDSISITSCKSVLSPSGEYTYNNTGYYNDTIPNSLGCDSVLTIHYIKTTLNNSLLIESCKSVVSPSGKYTYNNTGYYSDTLSTSQGCDSIITVHFTRTSLHDTVFVKSCDTVISPSV